MRPERLLNTPCTIRRLDQNSLDEYGNPADTWTEDQSLCWVDLRGRTTESSETAPPTNFAIETIDIYLAPDDTITAADEIKVGTKTYAILGPPHTFTHPRTQRPIYSHVVGRQVT